MPEIVHEQTGLSVRKNDKNGFVVCRLHFLADPAKRDPSWEREARKGMGNAKFDQEYNINYNAVFGERVFPQMVDFREKIVLSHPYPTIRKNQVCYGGLDFGLKNPTSFHVYTVLTVEGENGEEFNYIAAIWEHYEPANNISELVSALKECPYWNQIRWIAADPAIWKHDQVGGETLTSIYYQLRKAGLDKLVQGSRDEISWMAIMQDHWRNLEHQEPTFKIFSCCPNMIREFQHCVYVSVSDLHRRTKNPAEKIVDKDNHAMDDSKYFFNMGPRLDRRMLQEEQKKKKPLWRRHQ